MYVCRLENMDDVPAYLYHFLLLAWREVVQKDCQARNLNRKDAMDRSRWKKLIKIG